MKIFRLKLQAQKSGVRLEINDMPVLFMLSLYFLSYVPLWISVVFIDFCSILRNDAYLYTEYIGIVVI